MLIFSVLFFIKAIIFTTFLNLTEQVKPGPIIDWKTGKELSLYTHTYYAIQNQKTQRYLIWFGKNGTIDNSPDPKQGRFWHIFESLNGTWYKMSHHFGNHQVKIAKSHEEGYYQIFNRDCFNAEHPNADADENGTIKCFVPKSGDLVEFNWVFTAKKDNSDDVVETKSHDHNLLLKAVIPVITLSVIIAVIVYLVKTRSIVLNRSAAPVYFTQDNLGYVETAPPYIPQPKYY